MRVFASCLVAGLCALAAAPAVQAQTASNPALRSLPNPAGLRPMYPAGISSGSGAAQASSPIARANSPIPAGSSVATTPFNNNNGVPTELFPVDGVVTVPSTAVMGAGATVAGPSQYTNAGSGGYSATDIARSFFFADANHDGELSHAEARRLSIAPMSFEEMDRNFDGVISRFEYDDATR
jgi:hypothetical protein